MNYDDVLVSALEYALNNNVISFSNNCYDIDVCKFLSFIDNDFNGLSQDIELDITQCYHNHCVRAVNDLIECFSDEDQEIVRSCLGCKHFDVCLDDTFISIPKDNLTVDKFVALVIDELDDYADCDAQNFIDECLEG